MGPTNMPPPQPPPEMFDDTDIATAVLGEPREIRYCEYGSKIERTDFAQTCRQTCFPQAST